MPSLNQKPAPGRRRRLYEVVFESDTRAGRVFDLLLIWLILLSVLAARSGTPSASTG